MWYYLDQYILPICLSFGILGNIFILLIIFEWCDKKKINFTWFYTKDSFCTIRILSLALEVTSSRSSTNFVYQMAMNLLFLSITDIGFLVTAWINQINLNKIECSESETSSRCSLPKAFVNSFKGASDSIVILIACNRLKSILHVKRYNANKVSFRGKVGKKYVRYCQIIAQVIFADLFSFLFHLPFFLDHSVNGVCDFFAFNKTVSYSIYYKEKEQTSINCTVYISLYVAFLKCIPTVLIVTLNLVISCKLISIWKLRRNLRKRIHVGDTSLSRVKIVNTTASVMEKDKIRYKSNLDANRISSISFGVSNSIARIQEMNQRYEEHIKGNNASYTSHLKTPTFDNSTSEYNRYPESRKKRMAQPRWASFNKEVDQIIQQSLISISIAAVFVTLTTPSSFASIAIPIYHKPFPWVNTDYVVVTNFLEELNYACNFFIYCIANAEIRLSAKNGIRFGFSYITNKLGRKIM